MACGVFHERSTRDACGHSTSTYLPFVLSQSGWTEPRPQGGTVLAMSIDNTYCTSRDKFLRAGILLRFTSKASLK